MSGITRVRVAGSVSKYNYLSIYNGGLNGMAYDTTMNYKTISKPLSDQFILVALENNVSGLPNTTVLCSLSSKFI